MSFEERMEQLGRRAVEQEPAELALPRCIRASECVKPVSCVKYRVQRHGFGEGRLPIPAIIIKDKDPKSDASKQHQHSSDSPSKASARKAGKLLRPSQEQAQQQLDAIQARKSAAKAFSAALDRRNADLLQHSNKPASTAAAHVDEARPATPPHASSRASLSQQPLVERHIPPRRCDPVSTAVHDAAPPVAALEHTAATDACAAAECDAQAAAGADHATAHLVNVMAEPAAAAAAAGATLDHGGACSADQLGRCRTVRTFLTEASSQPPSPMRAATVAASVGADAGAALGVAPDVAAATVCVVPDSSSSLAGSSMPAAADLGAGCGTTDVHQPGLAASVAAAAAAAAANSSTRDSSLSAASTQTGSAAVAPAAAVQLQEPSASQHTKQQFSSSDASSRLLCFVHGAAGALSPLPRALSPAAAADVGQRAHAAAATAYPASPHVAAAAVAAAAACPVSNSNSLQQRPCSPSTRPGSPSRRPAGPCWSPVPPRTQLQPPVVVRPMADWLCEQEPMQQTPDTTQEEHLAQHTATKQQQQQQPSPALTSRPPWQGVKEPAASTAAVGLKAEASEGARNVGRRVSISAASVRSRGCQKGRRSTGGGTSHVAVAAAFSNPELAKLAAAAAEKVSKQRLVLPALCSCGHGTCVLDASYPQHCCSNCALRGNAAAYEQLLTGLLAGMGLD